MRNLVYGAMLFGSSVLFAELIRVLVPFEVRYLRDHGMLFSIFMLLVYVFLIDFIFYWYHRAQHRFAILWALHELHHSDTELNVTTSMRTYWLDRPIQMLLIAVPISYVVGIDTRANIFLPAVLTSWLFFTHANLRLRLGILTPVICGPQLHRIHHSTRPEHLNKNLAQFLPILDILFGTYYAPARDEFPRTGTPGLASNAGLAEVILKPFKVWLKFARDRVGK
jgi:sterol desaturase/sphingolipid hydroxylase (fatty acid hydroxylase superfamily)